MKQIKGLELISGSELLFGSCETGAVNMSSKEITVQVKKAISRLSKQNKSIREGERKKLQQWPNPQFGTFLKKK